MSSGYLIKDRIVTKPLRWLSGATRSSWGRCHPWRRLPVVWCSWYWNTIDGRHLKVRCRLARCSINGATRCRCFTFSGPSLGETTIIITHLHCPRFTSLKEMPSVTSQHATIFRLYTVGPRRRSSHRNIIRRPC
ncbi:hypothetical protein MRX96_010270 [Rhipicephalus microplus]